MSEEFILFYKKNGYEKVIREYFLRIGGHVEFREE